MQQQRRWIRFVPENKGAEKLSRKVSADGEYRKRGQNMSEWIRCPMCGTVMTVTTSGYLCPMCGTALPVKILHMTSGTSPKVDAVPVIRCRDCKFRMATKNRHKNKERIYCRLFFDPIEHHYYRCHDDDYCSRAERKEHETD